VLRTCIIATRSCLTALPARLAAQHIRYYMQERRPCLKRLFREPVNRNLNQRASPTSYRLGRLYMWVIDRVIGEAKMSPCFVSTGHTYRKLKLDYKKWETISTLFVLFWGHFKVELRAIVTNGSSKVEILAQLSHTFFTPHVTSISHAAEVIVWNLCHKHKIICNVLYWDSYRTKVQHEADEGWEEGLRSRNCEILSLNYVGNTIIRHRIYFTEQCLLSCYMEESAQ
jgi:hypothetical protein